MHCPLCSGTDLETYSDNPPGDLTSAAIGSSRQEIGCGQILRCKRCRLGFRASRVDEQRLARLYADLDIDVYQSEARGRLATAARHLGIIRRYSPPSRLLDIGCASGMFLRRAADEGWNVVGVEPSQQLSTLAKENLGGRGEIIPTTLQSAGLTDPVFDVITMWDVLEHVPYSRPSSFRLQHDCSSRGDTCLLMFRISIACKRACWAHGGLCFSQSTSITSIAAV